MHINWQGQYTLKIQTGSTTLVIDPYSPETGLKPFRAQADVVALTNPSESSMSHLDGVQGDPVIINSPGEYTVKGINIHALGWQPEGEKERSIQRYVIEGVTLLHLGALNRELEDNELQEIERSGIDVLFIPIGGGSGLETKAAVKLVTTIEPRVVIPIHFKLPKLKEKLEDVTSFAKEMGVSPSQSEKKTIIKANKLPKEDMETIILKP